VRTIVTGLDGQGRSTVVGIEQGGDHSGGDVVAATIWTTETSPPAVPRYGPWPEPAFDVGCPATGTIWRLVQMPPGYEFGRHRTDTLDYDTVVAGTLQLVLDADSVDLGPGDCVVLPGVPHAWRAGRAGATLNVVMTGLGPAAR
jgi:hypothetical protein